MAGAGKSVGEGRQLPLHRRNAVPRLAQPPFGLAHGIFRAQPGEIERGAPFLHFLFSNGFPVVCGGGGIEALGRVGAGLQVTGLDEPVQFVLVPVQRIGCLAFPLLRCGVTLPGRSLAPRQCFGDFVQAGDLRPGPLCGFGQIWLGGEQQGARLAPDSG